jgi:hypothetical protein
LFVISKQHFIKKVGLETFEATGGDAGLRLYLRELYRDRCIEVVLPKVSQKLPQDFPRPMLFPKPASTEVKIHLTEAPTTEKEKPAPKPKRDEEFEKYETEWAVAKDVDFSFVRDRASYLMPKLKVMVHTLNKSDCATDELRQGVRKQNQWFCEFLKREIQKDKDLKFGLKDTLVLAGAAFVPVLFGPAAVICVGAHANALKSEYYLNSVLEEQTRLTHEYPWLR